MSSSALEKLQHSRALDNFMLASSPPVRYSAHVLPTRAAHTGPWIREWTNRQTDTLTHVLIIYSFIP